MDQKKVAVVLCGIVPHITLIEKLKKRGYYTVLVDWLDNPPAKKVADLHIQESGLDSEVVLKIARKYKAALVIATNMVFANTVAVFVSEQLGLYTPFSSSVSQIVDSKESMKSRLIQYGVPTARYVRLKCPDDFHNNDLHFPVVVKPSVSYGSTGVRKADTVGEAMNFIEDAFAKSENEYVIVEEFCEGFEMSIYCFVQNGKAHVIFSNRRAVNSVGENTVMQGYGMIYPAQYSSKTAGQIQEIADGIVNAFQLQTTPLLIQVIANEHDVKVLEFALRIGGGYSYLNIEKMTGFDYINAAINAYEGMDTDLSWHKPLYFSSTNYVYVSENAVIGSYQIDQEDLRKHGVEEIFYHVRVGEKARALTSSGGRIMMLRISNSNIDDLLAEIKYTMEHIDVLDDGGKSIMVKDLYIKESKNLGS